MFDDDSFDIEIAQPISSKDIDYTKVLENADYDEALGKADKKAKKLLKKPDKLDAYLERAQTKLSSMKSPAGHLLVYIPTFIRMIRSYLSREYTDIDVKNLITIIASIIYFVSPIDLVPDFIPVLGFTDDAAALALCIKKVKNDLDKYMVWQEQSKSSVLSA